MNILNYLKMDVTLKQYLTKADAIHDNIINKDQYLSSIKTKNQLYELEAYIKQIQTISHRMAQIYNTCKKKYNNGLILHRGIKLKTVNPFPEKNNWSYISRVPDENSKGLAPNINVNVRVVNKCSDIPNTPLYWVESLNQFALHVNGVIFRGNVGNIYVKNPRGGTQGPNTKMCKHKNKCTFLLGGKKCKFYHDPSDVNTLYKEGKISLDVSDQYKKMYRNYHNMSFAYTNDVHKKQNKMMRFVGNRNTLNSDLLVSKYREDSDWAADYQSQTFHDFLVIMAMNQHGLIDEYPDVQMVSEEYSGDSDLVISFEK